MTRLWEKGLPLAERVLAFTAGEDHLLDARLVPYDVLASLAHAEMLAKQKFISADDCDAICSGLNNLGQAFADGAWQIRLEDEDVHTALESRLTNLIGAAGGRLHLGRSRNDQVLAALRLYALDATNEVSGGVSGLVQALSDLAERQGDF